jgi:uncharacterized protein YndB with AHSA1/START domain
MDHNLIVSHTIEVNASAANAWEVLTNPAIIKEYLFGTETITDWNVGSDIIFQGEYEGMTYKDKGVVRENILHKLLSYSYWSGFSGEEDLPENYSLVTYKLEPIDETTTLFTWTQKGFVNEKGCQHSLSGMDDFLKSIKAIMEREQANN